jgi:hypothetical protein
VPGNNEPEPAAPNLIEQGGHLPNRSKFQIDKSRVRQEAKKEGATRGEGEQAPPALGGMAGSEDQRRPQPGQEALEFA